MAFITTYTGKQFDPVHPDIDLIDIIDIAHALSYICRGNGHVSSFFSVGQHCIHCAKEAVARNYSNRLILACLLHDACEIYMSDVPSPFKQYLHDYNLMEEKMLDLVYIKFLGSSLTDEEYKLIKDIDHDMLQYDLHYLLNENTSLPEMKSSFSYDVLPFKEVEDEFLRLYKKYA